MGVHQRVITAVVCVLCVLAPEHSAVFACCSGRVGPSEFCALGSLVYHIAPWAPVLAVGGVTIRYSILLQLVTPRPRLASLGFLSCCGYNLSCCYFRTLCGLARSPIHAPFFFTGIIYQPVKEKGSAGLLAVCSLRCSKVLPAGVGSIQGRQSRGRSGI